MVLYVLLLCSADYMLDSMYLFLALHCSLQNNSTGASACEISCCVAWSVECNEWDSKDNVDFLKWLKTLVSRVLALFFDDVEKMCSSLRGRSIPQVLTCAWCRLRKPRGGGLLRQWERVNINISTAPIYTQYIFFCSFLSSTKTSTSTSP